MEATAHSPCCGAASSSIDDALAEMLSILDLAGADALPYGGALPNEKGYADRAYHTVRGERAEREVHASVDMGAYETAACAEVDAAISELMEITAVPCNVDVRPVATAASCSEEVARQFDANNNVLDPAVRRRFATDRIYEETYLFTEPVSTTNTMEGMLSNVRFHEKDLIEELVADAAAVLMRCNYGKVIWPGYVEYVRQRMSNRGRKKREKVHKNRKVQGVGNDFNSQITFFVVRAVQPPGQPINSPAVHKVKLFRNGRAQLPGAKRDNIDDVIRAIELVAEMVNFHLHPCETDPAKMSRLMTLAPVMSNAKFSIKLPLFHILDLTMLRRILIQEHAAEHATGHNGRRPYGGRNGLDTARYDGQRPGIYLVKYSRQDTKLSVKFSTPLPRKPAKRCRVNVFPRGRVNILGGFETHTSRQICDFLHWIVDTYYDDLVILPGDVQLPRPMNVAEPNECDIQRILRTAGATESLPDIFVSDYEYRWLVAAAEEEVTVRAGAAAAIERELCVGLDALWEADTAAAATD